VIFSVSDVSCGAIKSGIAELEKIHEEDIKRYLLMHNCPPNAPTVAACKAVDPSTLIPDRGTLVEAKEVSRTWRSSVLSSKLIVLYQLLNKIVQAGTDLTGERRRALRVAGEAKKAGQRAVVASGQSTWDGITQDEVTAAKARVNAPSAILLSAATAGKTMRIIVAQTYLIYV
jgi:hypothetical protein